MSAKGLPIWVEIYMTFWKVFIYLNNNIYVFSTAHTLLPLAYCSKLLAIILALSIFSAHVTKFPDNANIIEYQHY